MQDDTPPARQAARLVALALSLLSTASIARAADPVTDAMVAAYVPYRAALFQTNSASASQAADALRQARSAWADLMARHAGQAAAPYDRDTSFGATLREVDGLYAKAETQVQRGALAEAHETLERVREVLADLRQRNGVVVYSDHMNAYHAAMEHVLLEGKAWAAQPDGQWALAEQVGVLAYLANRLRSEAPESLRSQAAFTSMQQAVSDSVQRLREAVRAGQTDAVVAALGQLKGAYSKLFLRFG